MTTKIKLLFSFLFSFFVLIGQDNNRWMVDELPQNTVIKIYDTLLHDIYFSSTQRNKHACLILKNRFLLNHPDDIGPASYFYENMGLRRMNAFLSYFNVKRQDWNFDTNVNISDTITQDNIECLPIMIITKKKAHLKKRKRLFIMFDSIHRQTQEDCFVPVRIYIVNKRGKPLWAQRYYQHIVLLGNDEISVKEKIPQSKYLLKTTMFEQ